MSFDPCATTASDDVSCSAAPTACNARAPFSVRRLGAAPQRKEANVKIDNPRISMRRRPRRSARAPAGISSAAKGRMYALTTHSTSAKPPRRSRAIDGSDTATMFVSSMMRNGAPAQHSNMRSLRPENDTTGGCEIVSAAPGAAVIDAAPTPLPAFVSTSSSNPVSIYR